MTSKHNNNISQFPQDLETHIIRFHRLVAIQLHQIIPNLLLAYSGLQFPHTCPEEQALERSGKSSGPETNCLQLNPNIEPVIAAMLNITKLVTQIQGAVPSWMATLHILFMIPSEKRYFCPYTQQLNKLSHKGVTMQNIFYAIQAHTTMVLAKYEKHVQRISYWKLTASRVCRFYLESSLCASSSPVILFLAKSLYPTITRSLDGPRSSSCFLCLVSSSSNRLPSRASSLWCCSSLKLKGKKCRCYSLHTYKGPKWAIHSFSLRKIKTVKSKTSLFVKFYSSVFHEYSSDILDGQHQEEIHLQLFLLSDEGAHKPEASVTMNL